MKNLSRTGPSITRVVVYGIVAMILLGYSCWNFNGACNDIFCRVNCNTETCCNANGECNETCDNGCCTETVAEIGIMQAQAGTDFDFGDITEIISDIEALVSDNGTEQQDKKATKASESQTNDASLEGIAIKIINGLVALIGFILWMFMFNLPHKGDGMTHASS